MEQKRVKIDAFTGLVLEGGGMRKLTDLYEEGYRCAAALQFD